MAAAKNRTFSFKHEWLSQYGLQITARDPKLSEVISIKCRFCEFGRDLVDGKDRKRKKIKYIRFYKYPWRSDNMKRYVNEQHKVKYDEYSNLREEGKKQYFEDLEDTRPISSMIRNHNEKLSIIAKEVLVFNINKDIIEVIIRQFLMDYDPDDSEDSITITSENEQDIFTLVDDTETSHYEISWPNRLQFKMIVKYISVGISFQQCTKLLVISKEISGLGTIGNIHIGKVIQVVQYTCAFNMEVIYNILNHVWAFSIAIDNGTKASVPYLDVRLRFVLKGKLYNIHLIALPMYKSHTGENSFLLISKFLDDLCEK